MLYQRVHFDMYAQQLLRSHPYPPRSVDVLMLFHVVFDPVMLLLWLYAFVSAVMSWYMLQNLMVDWIDGIIPVVLLTGSMLAFVLPFYAVWNVHRAIRFGVYCEARVVAIFNRHKRFEKSIYGVVQGQLALTTAMGHFTATFDLDRAWAEHIQVGDRLAVVIYPTKQKLWMIAGPIR